MPERTAALSAKPMKPLTLLTVLRQYATLRYMGPVGPGVRSTKTSANILSENYSCEIYFFLYISYYV